MYQYNETDQTLINERVAQFKHQTERFLKGEISEDHYPILAPHERCLYSNPCAHDARRYPLWLVVFPANAQVGAYRP